MPVATLTSKGQITIPKKVRDALHLKSHDKVTIIAEEGTAIIKPVRGNILDIGASVQIAKGEKPIDFKKVRKKVLKKVAGNSAAEAGK